MYDVHAETEIPYIHSSAIPRTQNHKIIIITFNMKHLLECVVAQHKLQKCAC